MSPQRGEPGSTPPETAGQTQRPGADTADRRSRQVQAVFPPRHPRCSAHRAPSPGHLDLPAPERPATGCSLPYVPAQHGQLVVGATSPSRQPRTPTQPRRRSCPSEPGGPAVAPDATGLKPGNPATAESAPALTPPPDPQDLHARQHRPEADATGLGPKLGRGSPASQDTSLGAPSPERRPRRRGLPVSPNGANRDQSPFPGPGFPPSLVRKLPGSSVPKRPVTG